MAYRRLSGAIEGPNSPQIWLKYSRIYQHIVVVAHHPQANSLTERRIKEVLTHLRALVYEFIIKEDWSRYLPLVQRIINYSRTTVITSLYSEKTLDSWLASLFCIFKTSSVSINYFIILGRLLVYLRNGCKRSQSFGEKQSSRGG